MEEYLRLEAERVAVIGAVNQVDGTVKRKFFGFI